MTAPRPTVLSIGNFDGVHLGHRAIVTRARQIAQERGGRALILTFDPSPVSVLRPGTQPPRVMSLAQRTAELRAAGADEVRVLEPTAALLEQSPEQFIQRIAGEHHPVAVVEGGDFHFGKHRAGNVATLEALGKGLGFETIVVGPVSVALYDQLVVQVSSTLVRWLLAHGRVADAARCMARPFGLDADVVAGEKRGRTIGVPTINLDPAALVGRALPADGVYAGEAVLPEGSTVPAAISVGLKPTFKHDQRTVEAHLLDFTGDLYGRRVELRFAHWLRDQQPFPSVEALKRQLLRDIEETRRRARRDAVGVT